MKEKKKLLFGMVACIIVLSLALPLGSANAAKTDLGGPCEGVIVAAQTQEVARKGAWVDEVIITQEPVSAAAITKLGVNELDIYAFSITDPDLFATVVANPNINYVKSLGSYNEFTFNPVPFFTDGRFNPFGIPKIRESMNKLVDRDYIASEIQGGLAIPKFTALNAAFADARDRYPDLIAPIVAKYAYNKAAAQVEISAQMVAVGAYIDKSKGTWHYDAAEIEVILLIRTEDGRRTMGEYLGAQLEDIGFKCVYNYKTGAEAAPIWLFGDPAAGGFHIYTGGWVTTIVSRDQGGNFPYFYTDMGYPAPLWQAYDTDPEFYEVCQRLDVNDFTTMDQRRALFAKALPLAMEDSVRIWLTDNEGFSAFRKNVGLAADTAGGIYGSWMWGHTAHFKGADGKPAAGGNLRVAMPSVLAGPANPVAGSNWVYDMFWIRATGDAGWAIDTCDGLRWPHRFERAEITAKTGLPVGVSSALGHGSWCSLSFAPSIAVPGDAWSDWNAATQQFIPASTRFPGGTTALRKSVVYYPKDIFETPIHDGSTLSMGDFIIGAILTFDRAKQASPIYDPAAVASFNSFMTAFKGVKFITDDPNYGLIVETYSDLWYLDAELMATHWWPVYAQGPAVWHTLAVAIRAEADKQLAFSSPKATQLGVEWTSFIAGPSLQILRNQLTLAKAANYVPYAPTLGSYISPAEAAERYENLAAWANPTTGKGHFWVASGPFYLQQAFPLTKVIVLKRFEGYPDAADRWLFLLSCGGETYSLSISSTTGGSVVTPGEGTLTYGAGSSVNLVATPEPGYRFVNWAGDVDTIAGILAAETTITMEADYQITARFARILGSKTETVPGSGKIDAKAEADTEVEVSGTATVIVTVDRYAGDPGSDAVTSFDSSGGASSDGLLPLRSYIDVNVRRDPTYTDGEVTMIEVKLFYYADDVTMSGIKEGTLVLQWYDGRKWVECSETGVEPGGTDGYDGYIWAKIRANTTPSLDDLGGTPFGGYGSSPGVPQGLCAIATAAYGTDMAEEIAILREFRDVVLLSNSLGATFVSIYYRTSPTVADFISGHEILRATVRGGLVDPIVAVLNWSQGWWSVTGS